MTSVESVGRTRVRNLVLLAALASALGACVHGKLPPRELYRLRLPVPVDSVLLQRDHVGTLPAGDIAVMPYETPGLYGDREIVYRIGDAEYGEYPNREWALPLATMLGMITEDVLRATPVTADPAVYDPPSSHAYTYIWHGRVIELEEVDRGRSVYAAVRLQARLVRSTDDSVIWTGDRRFEREVPAAAMPAIVETLSSLAAQAIGDLAGEARAALAGSAASAVRPGP